MLLLLEASTTKRDAAISSHSEVKNVVSCLNGTTAQTTLPMSSNLLVRLSIPQCVRLPVIEIEDLDVSECLTCHHRKRSRDAVDRGSHWGWSDVLDPEEEHRNSMSGRIIYGQQSPTRVRHRGFEEFFFKQPVIAVGTGENLCGFPVTKSEGLHGCWPIKGLAPLKG